MENEKRKIGELENIVSILIDLIKSTSGNYDSVNKYSIKWFYLEMRSRFLSNLISIKLLLGENDNSLIESNVEHSIGLLIRNSLSDCMNVFYIIYKLDNTNYEQKKTEKIIADFYFDQINFTYEQLKQSLSLNLLTQDRFNELIKKLQEEFPEYFIDAPELPEKHKLNKGIFTKFPKGLKMVNELYLNHIFREDAIHLFELWNTYSKYEHYGPLTFSIKAKAKPSQHIKYLNLSLRLIIRAIEYIYGSFKFDQGSHFERKTKTDLKQLDVCLDRLAELYELY